MRILQVSHAYPPTLGGVETHLWDITHGLVGRGHAVHCLVGGDRVRESCDGVAVERHPELTVGSLIAARAGFEARAVSQTLLARMRRLVTASVEAFRPDIIHAHNAHHFAPELATAILGQRGIPAVNSVHDKVGDHVYGYVLDDAWAHVSYASAYLQGALPTTRDSGVIHLGVDLQIFTPDGPRDEQLQLFEPPVIFHPARLLRWKGISVGLAAFAEIVRRRRAAGLTGGTLVLCQSQQVVDSQDDVSAYRGELEREASALDVDDRIRFMEFPRCCMPAAYRASDLVWYPTIDEEPLGLVPLEAMACGAPLVVSASGGMRETVVDGVNGLVVAKHDASALAEAALQLLGDHALRTRLREGARAGLHRYSGDAYVGRLEAVYRRLMHDLATPVASGGILAGRR